MPALSSSPLVSVVIPCFEQARYLHDSVGKLANQTLGEWEAIIVDDGSSDDTAGVAQGLAALDPRVRWVRQPHGGVSSARNAGLEACRGRFVQLLDADDFLHDHKLRDQVDFLSVHPQFDLVYGNAWYFRDGIPELQQRSKTALIVPGAADTDWISQRAQNPLRLLEKLMSWNLFPVNAPLLRREVVGKVGRFDERLPALEDWEYWIRAAALGVRFAFNPLETNDVFIRLHPASMTHDALRMSRAEYQMAIATLRYIHAPELRRRTFQRAISGLNKQTDQVWRQVHQDLRDVANGFDEAAALLLQRFLFKDLKLPGAARRALRRLAPNYLYLAAKD